MSALPADLLAGIRHGACGGNALICPMQPLITAAIVFVLSCMWREHTDLPDATALRRELDRDHADH